MMITITIMIMITILSLIIIIMIIIIILFVPQQEPDSVLQNTRFLTHLKLPGAYTSRRRVAQILRRQFEEPDLVEIN